jgi:hypothetical protein
MDGGNEQRITIKFGFNAGISASETGLLELDSKPIKSF